MNELAPFLIGAVLGGAVLIIFWPKIKDMLSFLNRSEDRKK